MAKHRAPRPHHIELAGLVAALTIPAFLVTTAMSGTTPTELGAGTAVMSHSAPAADRQHAPAAHIEEDDPAWSCWVDGNGLCSTVTLDGAGLS